MDKEVSHIKVVELSLNLTSSLVPWGRELIKNTFSLSMPCELSLATIFPHFNDLLHLPLAVSGHVLRPCV